MATYIATELERIEIGRATKSRSFRERQRMLEDVARLRFNQRDKILRLARGLVDCLVILDTSSAWDRRDWATASAELASASNAHDRLAHYGKQLGIDFFLPVFCDARLAAVLLCEEHVKEMLAVSA